MTSIRDAFSNGEGGSGRFLCGESATVLVDDVLRGTSLGGRRMELLGRSVLVVTRDELTAALALIELDGVVRRMVVCTPHLPHEYLPELIASANVDAIVSDYDVNAEGPLGVPLQVACGSALTPAGPEPLERLETEWVLLTSGTMGAPKMVSHSLAGLTAAIDRNQNRDPDVVWGTFYDIRRYGGLQILLRAVLGRGSFVLSGSSESVRNHLLRLGTHGVTHISGTPSHWRRVMMSPAARAIEPRYVRLSGEIADQAILNTLSAFYPQAKVGHAFASTEAGVAFEVNDGLEGFPASVLTARPEVQMKVENGSLRIRSNRNAACYVGGQSALAAADGFVDTSDMVELRGDRYYFLGRRGGLINIGGLKVYPEEVEAVINRHPAVRMSVVRSKRSSITGALVAADVVLKDDTGTDAASIREATVRREILSICREALPQHKVPAMIHVVPTLEVGAAGKLARHDES